MSKAKRGEDLSYQTGLQPFQADSVGPPYMEMTRSDRNMAALLEKAFRIKEDMVRSLQATQGSVLKEASARKFLENHINIITHIVKQLSKDIQVLEAQIVQRDSVASGTTLAVQNLDHKNLTVVGDLRGRVARCDATIAKLSTDVRAGGQEIMKLQQEVSEIRSAIELRLSDFELKISQSLGQLETVQSEQRKSTTRDLQRDFQQLEIKTSSGLKDLEDEVARIRRWTEQQLSSTTQTYMQKSQQLQTLLQDKVVDLEGKLKTQADLHSTHLGRVETQLNKERSVDRGKRVDSKLTTRIDSLEKSIRQELEQMRMEYQSGFQSIHDAIATLRHIGDTKAKLDKGELKKDIRQIQRMMAGLADI